jgi:hypothetical protein
VANFAQEGSNYLLNLLGKGGTIAADVMWLGIVTGTVWAPGTVYATNALVKNGTDLYVCTTGGTSAGSGGPTGLGTGITDNTCTWAHIGTRTLATIPEATGGSYGRKNWTSANANISAGGVLSMAAAVQWGTGITLTNGIGWFLTNVTSGTAGKLIAWGLLSTLRTLTTADSMTENISDVHIL